jgi:hypothetical protein
MSRKCSVKKLLRIKTGCIDQIETEKLETCRRTGKTEKTQKFKQSENQSGKLLKKEQNTRVKIELLKLCSILD